LSNDPINKIFNVPLSAIVYHEPILVGTPSGVFRSIDNAESWTKLGLSYEIHSLAIDSNRLIYAGAGSSIFRTSIDGNIWTTLPGEHNYLLGVSSNGYLYDGGTLKFSTDRGESWTIINNGLTGVGIDALAFHQNGNMYAGGSSNKDAGVYRSTDNGGSWTRVLSSPDVNSVPAGVHSLVINSTGYIFAGTYGNGIYRSTDNGDNWTKVNNGLKDTIVESLQIKPNGIIFAGTAYGGIFRTSNNGDNWTQVNSGLGELRVYSLGINSSGYIFAGTSRNGVFRSMNDGDSWIQVNNGLTNMRAWTITIGK
jgi:photosystem II stability/assembly factor-like uncharacterized protein